MSSLYEKIKADLGYLKLDAAAGVFATLAEEARAEDWSHIESLARLVAEQATADPDRRLAARLRYARSPHQRSSNDFDYEFQPSVNRKLVEDLATLRFIDENRPILFLGQPGCGKPTSPSPSQRWPSRPATAATSPSPTTSAAP